MTYDGWTKNYDNYFSSQKYISIKYGALHNDSGDSSSHMTLFILGEFSSPRRGDGIRMRLACLIFPHQNVYNYIYIYNYIFFSFFVNRRDIIN